jgi:hypothetical protein
VLEVHLFPDFNLSGMKKVDFKAPEFHLSDFELPKVDMPKVDMPKVDFSKVDLPKVEIPDMATIRRFGRPAPRSNPIWPWALVMAGAALFAAWWLATSTMTGPKVRRLAGRARERIETMRSSRLNKEGEDREASSSGWASDQDWHESAESGPAADRSGASL